MSDLIDRLRYRAAARDDDLATEAADRIAALEAALRSIRDDGKNCADHCRRQAGKALRISARAALAPESEK